MNHCKDCKHFDPPTKPYENGYGECAMGDARSGEPTNANTLAFGYDYESYSSGMSVKPEFGCIQFEAKE